MTAPTIRFGEKALIMMLILFISVLVPVNANLSSKLDETSMPQAPNLGMKCTTCSCTNPCDPQLPPPPPPPPPPEPSSQYCNPISIAPPPPPRFVYFTSPLPLAPPPPQGFVYFSGPPPPGNSYRGDPDNSDYFLGGTGSDVISVRGLIGFGLLQVLTVWLLLVLPS